MTTEGKFKVGDRVAIVDARYGGARGPYAVRKLHARTGNVMLEGSDAQYDGVRGYKRGDRWTRDKIEIWEEKHEITIKRAAILHAIRVFNFEKLPLAELEQVAEIIAAAKTAKAA